MSHTPGPWRHVPWHIAEGPDEVRAPEGWLICAVASSDDARLIAAAPDLLLAGGYLLAQLDRIGMTREEEPLMEALRAAIAEATGVPPPAGGFDPSHVLPWTNPDRRD